MTEEKQKKSGEEAKLVTCIVQLERESLDKSRPKAA